MVRLLAPSSGRYEMAGEPGVPASVCPLKLLLGEVTGSRKISPRNVGLRELGSPELCSP
jgi:hypothetical protein